MPLLLRARPTGGVEEPPAQTTAGRRFKRIYGPGLLSTSATTLYTVPTATRTVIRHIHVSNRSASSVDFTLSIGTDATGTRLWSGQPVGVDRLIQHFRDHTLTSGEIIQAFASSASALNLTIDGYEESLTSSVEVEDGVSYGDGTFGSGTYGG